MPSPITVELVDASTHLLSTVGREAFDLSSAIDVGLEVPRGFCVTTRAWRRSVDLRESVEDLEQVSPSDTQRLATRAAATRNIIADSPIPQEVRAEIVAAYRRLGDDATVVVQSSQVRPGEGHDAHTQLVCGEDAIIAAIQACWEALWTQEAVCYRATHHIDHRSVAAAVVVRRMVVAEAEGALFTADPVTGKRHQPIVHASRSLGGAVDHYVLDQPGPESGCLTSAQLDRLRDFAARLSDIFSSEQEAGWAIDDSGTLWLTRTRPITTLFPTPQELADDRVLLSVSHPQGFHGPVTPMGGSVLALATAYWGALGVPSGAFWQPTALRSVGGRVYTDITDLLHDRKFREHLAESHGPRAARAVRAVVRDRKPVPASFTARWAVRLGSLTRLPWRLATLRAFLRPANAASRMARHAGRIREAIDLQRSTSPTERIVTVRHITRILCGREMRRMVAIGRAATVSRRMAVRLLRKAGEAEVDEALRGAPHNPVTAMDLRLAELATTVRDQRESLLNYSATQLTQLHSRERLPSVVLTLGLESFLAEYGHCGVTEIDVGLPRWREAPAPVLAALLNHLRADPQNVVDTRRDSTGARAALVSRAGFGRRKLAAFLLRRAHQLAGLREIPRFVSLDGYDRMRAELLATGEALRHDGWLRAADDIMFLTLDEVESAMDDDDLAEIVTRRRAEHQQNRLYRRCPVVLLSDGTEPEALASPGSEPGLLRGAPAAAGTVTGTARVLYDPSQAWLEPGDIVVAPQIDPGWTLLLPSLSGLVAESGTVVSPGAVAARDYGVPTVVSVRGATAQLRDGDKITVDAYAGTVRIVD